MKKHPNSDRNLFKRLIRYLSKHRWSYVLVCLLVVIIVLVTKLIINLNGGDFDLKRYLDSIIDVKTFVTVVLVFVLTVIANIITELLAPKVEDFLKLTKDYDKLVNKYKAFSTLLTYKNKDSLNKDIGRKKTSSFAHNFNKEAGQYDGLEDSYTFPIIKLTSLYDKTTVIVFDFDKAPIYKRPSWVEKHSDDLFTAHSHSKIYNQQNIRVDNIECIDNKVNIYLSKTTYFDSLITNRACDYEINGVSVRELYEPGPYLHDLKDSLLSNHLGFNGMVETSDHKFIFIKRHNKVSIAKNTLQASIGASLKVRNALTKDKKIDTSSVSNAIIKEMVDEFSLRYLNNYEEVLEVINKEFSFKKNVLYFYRDLLECGKPQLMFYYKLPISSNEIETAFKVGIKKAKRNKDKYGLYNSIDGHKMIFVDKEDLDSLYLTPDGITIDKKFYPSVPSAVATVVMMLDYLNNSGAIDNRNAAE